MNNVTTFYRHLSFYSENSGGGEDYDRGFKNHSGFFIGNCKVCIYISICLTHRVKL